MIPRTVLIACQAFAGSGSQRVGEILAEGLADGGWQADVCPIAAEGERPGELRAMLDALDIDARLRRARAVVLSQGHLELSAAAASPIFEIATRARQAGVPAYAVTDRNVLDAFAARMLDLQLIIEAPNPRALVTAARRLAELI